MRILLLIALLPVFAFASTYEWADLKALERDKSWPELVEHLTDIVPSQRGPEWKALAEKAIAGVLDVDVVKDEDTAQAMLFQIEALMKRFGWLQDSKAFMAKRAEVGLKAMGWTYNRSRHSSGDDPWLDSLKAFVAIDKQTGDLALRAAKLIMGRLVPLVAFPLFKTALAQGGATLCKDSDLQRSVLGALSDGLWKKEVSEVLKTCWGELKPLLLNEVMKPDASRTVRMKLCVPLHEHNGLTSTEERARCAFE